MDIGKTLYFRESRKFPGFMTTILTAFFCCMVRGSGLSRVATRSSTSVGGLVAFPRCRCDYLSPGLYALPIQSLPAHR